ncbi:hypothetical protein CBR_g19845 [Chara braunii]|uniref:CCHC-type domain-containing protein n=1 Tax=Chara braunii TaxID=69332 RepID=A0A388KYT3_CHABU|nr:hypothetical protein CBR_g19845 [Chara braunii]|eukprot:GBG75209.1 hypothetical protein CBR_g19845 [Chara braunii]
MPEEMADGGRRLVTLDDLIDALDKRERTSSNVPKVETFHFKGDQVSDWLDLTEQALVGLSDEVKLKRVLRWGKHIDPKTPGGIRQETLRRAAAGPLAAPTMFRIWQEREDPGVRVEEIVDESEEVTQQLKAGAIKEKPIVVESDDEAQEVVRKLASTILERMKDLLAKVGRYQERLRVMCEEAREWEMNLPEVMRYGSGPESSSRPQGCPSVATVEAGPRSGMTFRPPTSHGRVPHAAQTRGQSKATASQGPSQAPGRTPPRREPEPERRKEVVEVQEEEEEGDDEEHKKLRHEEDQRAEQRAKKRGIQGGAEPSLHDGAPKRKKYAVRLEEGFDVERMVDKLLEGHNDLMNLKDILASALRLRGELKGRLSRKLVPNVHLSSILPRDIEWTEAGTRMDWKCVACGLVDLKVRDQPSIAMVDTGAEMNIIRERDATMLGLEVDHSDHGVLHGANCKAIFCGTASNVMVEIGRVRARTCYMVMPDVDHPILLGRSFLCRTETLVFNRHEGTMILTLSDPACGNYEIIKCRNTGPGSGRNRLNLGSFTFEESEYARQRLREEQEEEGAGEVLSLSLSDVNKAMEVVAAHDMADPEAIKALREQVLESPQDLQRLNAVTVRDAGGLPNADALSEHMIRVMQTVSSHITQPYIDDLAVKGPKEKEEDEVMPGVRRFVWKHIQDIDQVLGLLEEHNLTASIPKSKHCMREATILGFVCNEKGRRPDAKKTDKILEWPVPFQSITDVRSFLGTCGFWRSFVKDFATKTEHLRKLVRQDQEWVWGEDQEKVVERMKGEFKEGGLVLGAPNYEATEEKTFVVETDAGPTALGGVLIQADADGKERPLRSDFSKAIMQRGGRDARPRQEPQRAAGRGEQHKPPRREPTPEFDDDNIELFLDVYRDHAAQGGCYRGAYTGRATAGIAEYEREDGCRGVDSGRPGAASEKSPKRNPRREVHQSTRQADEEAGELTEMGDLGFSVTRMAIELGDRRMREVEVTPFQRYSLLDDEVTTRRLEVEHLTTQLAEERARSQAREVKWERRFGEMAAIVDRLSATWEASQTGRVGADGQGRGMHASPIRGAAVEAPRQAGPMGEVPLDMAEEEGGAQESLMAMSTERRGSHSHELAAAMGIGTPQERPWRLDTSEYAPRLGELRAELGSWATRTDSGGPDSGRQQQQEVTSEPAAVAGSQPSGACGDVVVTERPHEEGPRELDTSDYRPVSTTIREGESVEAMESGPQGHMGLPSCHEVTTETMGTPSALSSQGRKKKTTRWHDTSCFWCKEEGHRAVNCPELLEDKAEGRVAEFNGKFYNRQGRIVERAPDGGRAQLYRQNQEELCK